MQFSKSCLIFLCLFIITQAHSEYIFQTTEYPPYVCAKHPNPKGLAISYISELLASMKLNAKIEVVPWSRALTKSKLGINDAIFPAAKTSERENFLLYSKEPIFIEEIVAIGKSSATKKLSGEISDFTGKKICSAQGYSIGQKIDAAQKQGLFLRISESSQDECLNDVINEVCDFYLTDKIMAESILKKLNPIKSEKISISNKIYESTPTYIAFSKSGKLVDKINEINVIISKINAEHLKSDQNIFNFKDCN